MEKNFDTYLASHREELRPSQKKALRYLEKKLSRKRSFRGAKNPQQSFREGGLLWLFFVVLAGLMAAGFVCSFLIG